MSTIPKSEMRTDLLNLVDEWGVSTKIRRFSSATALDGRLSGAYVSIATEVLWVQPIDGMSRRFEPGLLKEVTHLVFQRYTGTALSPKDRLLPSTETYELDVHSVHVKENHVEIFAKKVDRS